MREEFVCNVPQLLGGDGFDAAVEGGFGIELDVHMTADGHLVVHHDNNLERMCGAGGMVRIAVADRHVMFYIGSTELISRRLEGQFLNYKGAIPQNNPITVTADAKELMQSLDRVSVVINEKIKSPVRCNVGSGEMRFSAKTAIGAATDKCKIGGDGKDLEIGFNHRYLYDTLRFAAEQKVNISLNTNVTPAVITPTDGSGKFLYMVLPVRLKTK